MIAVVKKEQRMKRIEQPAAIVQTAEETEQQLVDGIAAAEGNISNASWAIGERASKLHKQFNWTDDRIATATGTSQQWINVCRRVWETFGDVYYQGSKVSFGHYREAVSWDDSEEWLATAGDENWSPARMKSERDAHYGKSALDDAVESTAPQSSARRQNADQPAEPEQPKTYNDTFDAGALDAADGDADGLMMSDDEWDDQSGTEPESIVLDAAGMEVPKHLKRQHDCAAAIQAAASSLEGFRKTIKALAGREGGEWIELQEIETAITRLKKLTNGARYYCVCPACGGDVGQCPKCNNAGWLPYDRKETFSAEEQAWIEGRRCNG